MLKVRWYSFLSFFGTDQVTQKMENLLVFKFHWFWRDIGGLPRITKKMMDIWKVALDSG